ncbi:mitofilin family membrane protein, partial [Roseibacterium sp. SDUM158017]|uniref:COG4223 family protein n=1 Tax=Roseicyclus salinarum TaxID=3036773 RepID=UPI0024159155
DAAAAAAQAEAEAAAAEARAEAALQRLRLAVAEGGSFADALGSVAEVAEVPEALSAAADSGVPGLEELQESFPAAARDALPVALRETAGDGAMDRIGAFLQGQIGGRSIEPREGDDPDAILSRAQAAVSEGDLQAALAEISALPDGARAAMADWISAAETRVAVTDALDTVAQSVTGAN